MPKTVAKILDLLSTKIVEKYKPVIIGVFDDGEDGAAAAMIKQVLEKRFDVRLSGKICDPDVKIPLAIIGADREAFALNANALARGIGLAFTKAGDYPNVVILRIEAHRAGDMKKMLKIVRPNIAVFASGAAQAAESGSEGKKPKRSLHEKAQLLRCLRKNDVAIFSADDEALKEMAGKSRCSKMTFGFGEEAEVRGKIFQGEEVEEARGKKGTSFKITYKGTFVPFHFSSGTGEGQIYAALAAAAVGLHLGSNLVEISEALRR